MNHRRVAIAVIVAAVALDVLLGVAYSQAEHASIGMGLYCAAGNAVTEGACTAPATAAGHWVNVFEFLSVVPLVSAVFSLLTSGLTSMHVKRAEERIKQHVTMAQVVEGEVGMSGGADQPP